MSLQNSNTVKKDESKNDPPSVKQPWLKLELFFGLFELNHSLIFFST